MTDITPNQLEVLPDEIFLEIFKYVKPIDLHSFIGLNRRINNVIQDVQLNVVICSEGEEENFDYLKSFLPKQIIRLELRYEWEAFDINVLNELRSLTVDYNCLSENQRDQVLKVNLPYLEFFFIDNVSYFSRRNFLLTILENQQFPSLRICKFLGSGSIMSEVGYYGGVPNNTVRTLVLGACQDSQITWLLNLLPNLHRFETVFENPIDLLKTLSTPHMSLTHLRVTLEDPSDDLNELLRYMPNMKVLNVTGKINDDSTALKEFEKLAKIFRTYTPGLQRFDCELYFHARNAQIDILVIQQLHPLFKMIQCHLGKGINQCYATHLTKYPFSSKYTYWENDTAMYSGVMRGYDSDEYYSNDEDDDNGWVEHFGLNYHDNYKANYGSSPWEGNNDDD